MECITIAAEKTQRTHILFLLCQATNMVGSIVQVQNERFFYNRGKYM